MGPLRRRDSTRARKARPRKEASSKTAHSASRVQPDFAPRLPVAIELAIGAQQEALATSITLLYCLHSALRREIDDAGKFESDDVEDAAESADLTEITAMLLVRLNEVHGALDSVTLRQAAVDPERLRLGEAARALFVGGAS